MLNEVYEHLKKFQKYCFGVGIGLNSAGVITQHVAPIIARATNAVGWIVSLFASSKEMSDLSRQAREYEKEIEPLSLDAYKNLIISTEWPPERTRKIGQRINYSIMPFFIAYIICRIFEVIPFLTDENENAVDASVGTIGLAIFLVNHLFTISHLESLLTERQGLYEKLSRVQGIKTIIGLEQDLSEAIQSEPLEPGIDGLKWQTVPADNHCLYHAIGLSLGEDQAFIRHIVAANLEENIDAYREFITLPPERTLEAYIEDIRG